MKRAMMFAGLAYLFSWTFWLVMMALLPQGSFIYTALFMWGPFLAALVMVKAVEKGKMKEWINLSWKLNTRWFWIAWLIMPAAIFAVLGVNLLLPGVSFSPDMSGYLSGLPTDVAAQASAQLQQFSPAAMVGITIVSGLSAGITINALFAFGEEAGWRGYMLNSLKGMNFWKASLLIGAVWGLWHAPLVLAAGHNYPDHRVAGVFMMMAFCVLLTPPLIYFTRKSKTVLSAAVFHGTLNAVAGMPVLFLAGGNDLLNGIAGLAGFIVLGILNVLMVLFDVFVTKERMTVGKV